MTPDDRVKELLEVWEDARDHGDEPSLEDLCGGDDELLHLLKKQVRALQEMKVWLTDASQATSVDRRHDAETSGNSNRRSGTSPSQIGRYEVVHRINNGGMGVVYLCRQRNPNRLVAVKMIRPGRMSATAIARFQYEVSVLGRLNHPGIAQLYEAGADEACSDEPYFAMEYVDGMPIVAYAGAHHLNVRERVELIVEACSAVQHAHQNGIIHRDLKPTNILVRADGRVKVLDFGIALATEGLGIDAPPPGPAGEALGTPAYMSPEQAAGDSHLADARSDVWGLGVVLHELLGSSSPFIHLTPLRTLNAIRHDPPPPLGALRAPFAKDLESICLKCLAKSPADRYASCQHLVDDLGRWLRGEPTVARPLSRRARLGRWAHRQPAAAAASCLLALLALLIPTALTVVAVNAQRHADVEARLRLQARNAIDQYVSTVTDDAILNQAHFRELRAKLLQGALKFYKTLSNEQLQNSVNGSGSAESFREIALIYNSLGMKREAREAFLANRDMLLRVLRNDPGNVALRCELAAVYDGIGVLESEIGSQTVAKENHEQALEIQRDLVEGHAEVAEYKNDLARTLSNLATLLIANGERVGAISLLEEAVTIERELLEGHRDEAEYQSMLAAILGNLGFVQCDVGELDAAERSYKEALQLNQVLADDHDAESAETHRANLANAYNDLAVFQSGVDQPAAAEQSHSRALAIQELLVHDNPTLVEFRGDLARTYLNLGALRCGQTGRFEDAADAYRKALAIQEQLAEEFPDVAAHRYELATAYSNLGVVEDEFDQLDAAKEHYLKSIEILRQLVNENETNDSFANRLAAALGNLGLLLTKTGGPSEAETHFRESVEILTRITNDHPTVIEYQGDAARMHSNLAVYLQNADRLPEAQNHLNEARRIQSSLVKQYPQLYEFNSALATTYTNLAALHSEMSQRKEAEGWLQLALVIQKKLTKDFPTVAEYWSDLSGVYRSIGQLQQQAHQFAAAEQNFAEASLILSRLATENPTVVGFQRDLASTLSNVGLAQRELLRLDDALKSHRESYDICERLLSRDPTNPERQGALAWAFVCLGDVNDALDDDAKALAAFAAGIEQLRGLVAEHPTVDDYRDSLSQALCAEAIVFAKGGQVDRVMANVGRHEALLPGNADARYLAGATFAKCAGACEKRSASGPSGLESDRRRYAELAIAELEAAIQAGFDDFDGLSEDPQLAAIRSLPGFQTLIRQAADARGESAQLATP